MAQPSLFETCPVREAVAMLSEAGHEERGAVFTRREVVDFILDLTGYTTDKPLHQLRLLEPSFGEGDFLIPAISRLLAAWNAHARPAARKWLAPAIRGVELHRHSYARTRAKAEQLLREEGISAADTAAILNAWLIYGDFLLAPLDEGFDVAVGNPPYVRQELIPDALMLEYRRRFTTIYDRADIYVPFIERTLRALKKGGQLGFICADRWTKNKYGGPLRKLVSESYHLKYFIDMVDTPAFLSDVIAYPAITVIAKTQSGPTRIAARPAIDKKTLGNLAVALSKPRLNGVVQEIAALPAGASPWVLHTSPELDLVRRLETELPTLEEAGCAVGIGVATGADAAFIGSFDDLDVEPDRKLPLVMTKDIKTGHVEWRGLGVINPFGPDGKLVDLARFPKLRRYLEARKDVIAKRHVAKKAPANWYRTIDRIYPELTARSKLLIPDIKGDAQIVFEEGRLYPHHNLYFITSEAWDLRALQAVLLSGIARLFISTYSTKMRGGYLRFQAQYLRRIRLPSWNSVRAPLRRKLMAAAKSGDMAACNAAVAELYNLNDAERVALMGEEGTRGA
ncbi:MAG: Eco57I restriction-modification methylase domain-containing protein [Hyphomonadaceae bacterium]